MSSNVLFSDFDALTTVRRIDKEGGVSIPHFLHEQVRLALLKELEQVELTQQPEVYGAYGVKQAFSSLDSFSKTSMFLHVTKMIEKLLEAKFRVCTPYPLLEPVRFSDIVVQRYPAGPVGISPHRDGKSFINIIAVIVLEGKGRFCFCDDRAGSNPRPIHNEAGSLILMRGVGFLGADIQPFHFVDQITEQRTTFALRQK